MQRGSEDGLIASQLAILMPALLLLIMLAVQFGLWAHASQLAALAADAGATAASLQDATQADGEAAAAVMLAQAGNLTDVAIVVSRDEEWAFVQVRGVAPNVVPGFRWSVSAEAAAPVERFIPQGDRP